MASTSTKLTGELFLAGERVRSKATFSAVEAQTGNEMQPPFFAATAANVTYACERAWSAFEAYRKTSMIERAGFLEAIATQILALGDELLARASAESGLPVARITNERGRTASQLQLFAAELRRGGWLGVRIDPALPERTPLPRPDLRMYKVPLGPVAVFGASNFPLAFSVAGGDTAAALAAGCSVIVKGHPAHPGTSELIASAIDAAVRACDLPAGVFSLLQGESHELGTQLVRDPRVKAVGFTGSRAGGLALTQIATARAEPIPVYAEMSSVNPVVLLPHALSTRAETLANGFIASVTLGAGQFCTNPGVVLAVDGAPLQRFLEKASAALRQVAPATMLTRAIHGQYELRLSALLTNQHTTVLARGAESSAAYCGRAALFEVAGSTIAAHPELLEEVFGPASIVVRCASIEELRAILSSIEGQLTTTMHFEAQDFELARTLVEVLERKSGRLIANGWPTGVEVSHAMVHGGPFPAASDGRSTSVGTLAIERFLRPVCYQDFPASLLPAPLREDGFTQLPHRYDGRYLPGDDMP